MDLSTFGSSRRFTAAAPRLWQWAALVDACRRGNPQEDQVREAAARYARDGESLQTVLDDLDQAFSLASLPAPDVVLIRAVALAWSDTFLGLYSRITCVDPLTGLASRQHLQMHVAGLYASVPQDRWAMIVIETGQHTRAAGKSRPPGGLVDAVQMTVLRSAVGEELVRGELVTALSARRIGVLAARDERLTGLVVRLEERARGIPGLRGGTARVWVEGLPATTEAAASVIDELCR